MARGCSADQSSLWVVPDARVPIYYTAHATIAELLVQILDLGGAHANAQGDKGRVEPKALDEFISRTGRRCIVVGWHAWACVADDAAASSRCATNFESPATRCCTAAASALLQIFPTGHTPPPYSRRLDSISHPHTCPPSPLVATLPTQGRLCLLHECCSFCWDGTPPRNAAPSTGTQEAFSRKGCLLCKQKGYSCLYYVSGSCPIWGKETTVLRFAHAEWNGSSFPHIKCFQMWCRGTRLFGNICGDDIMMMSAVVFGRPPLSVCGRACDALTSGCLSVAIFQPWDMTGAHSRLAHGPSMITKCAPQGPVPEGSRSLILPRSCPSLGPLSPKLR